MARLLPEHERVFREKTLFFAFQHARRDLPPDTDWSNEDLRGKVAGRIAEVYGELAPLLGTAPDDAAAVSADALHCNGSEAEFEIHYQAMILMLGERVYNSLAQRFVAHRQ